MGDFFALGMEHITVAIPDLDSAGTFALFDDFIHRSQCSSKILNRNDAPPAAVKMLVGDLPGRVTAKNICLTKPCREREIPA
jgi:hypothetical protein